MYVLPVLTLLSPPVLRYKSKFAVSVRNEWEADRHAHLSMGEAETRLPGPELYLRQLPETCLYTDNITVIALLPSTIHRNLREHL
jgi:hypothetical protein